MPILKVKYGNLMVRFTVIRSYSSDVSPTFNEFEKAIRKALKIPATCEFFFTYIDEDNDVVVMTCNEDLRQVCGMQGLKPLHLTIVPQDSPQPSANDARPHEPLAVDPPAWAAEIMLKLDQVLQAVNNRLVQPGGGSMNTISMKTVHQIAEGLGFAVVDDSTIQPAQSGHESAQAELLRRAMILQQRVVNESDDTAELVSEDSETYSKHEDKMGQEDAQSGHESEFMRRAMILQQRLQNEGN